MECRIDVTAFALSLQRSPKFATEITSKTRVLSSGEGRGRFEPRHPCLPPSGSPDRSIKSTSWKNIPNLSAAVRLERGDVKSIAARTIGRHSKILSDGNYCCIAGVFPQVQTLFLLGGKNTLGPRTGVLKYFLVCCCTYCGTPRAALSFCRSLVPVQQ